MGSHEHNLHNWCYEMHKTTSTFTQRRSIAARFLDSSAPAPIRTDRWPICHNCLSTVVWRLIAEQFTKKSFRIECERRMLPFSMYNSNAVSHSINSKWLMNVSQFSRYTKQQRPNAQRVDCSSADFLLFATESGSTIFTWVAIERNSRAGSQLNRNARTMNNSHTELCKFIHAGFKRNVRCHRCKYEKWWTIHITVACHTLLIISSSCALSRSIPFSRRPPWLRIGITVQLEHLKNK